MLERLRPFIGAWKVEAAFPRGGGMTGQATFEWDLGGHFLVQRIEVEHPPAPNVLAIVAPAAEGEGFTQHYFDSRGVVRIYAMTFEDGVWRLERTKPDFSALPFSQRFTGAFSDEGHRIYGHWEKTDDAGAFELDFALTYTRVR